MGHASSRHVPAWARWSLVALVAGVILVGSVLPGSAGVVPPSGPGPVELVGADKWFHALAYAGLAWALSYAFDATERSALAVVALALGLAVAFGLAVEVVQAPLPTRRFELVDAVANGAGATVAVLVRWAVSRSRDRTPGGETG